MILVTGAKSNVGRELIFQLLGLKQDVRVITQSRSEVAYLSGRAECCVADPEKPETLSGILKGAEKIFLASSNTHQDQNILEEAKNSRVGLIVKLSGFEADLRSPSWHGKALREREELVQASGLSWTFLRPALLSDMALIWARSIARDGVIYCPCGGGKVAPVDPYDVAAVAARALTQDGHEGQTYALTGPALLSIEQMAGVFARYLDKPVEFIAAAESEFIRESTQYGMRDESIQKWLEVFKSIRQGKCSYLTDTVERITGHSPRSFGTWCQNHLAAFQPRARVEGGAYI